MSDVVFETRLTWDKRCVCLFKNELRDGVWRIAVKDDGEQAAEEHFALGFIEREPFDREHCNIYRDHCVYWGDAVSGFRRIKDRLVRCSGLTIDLDSHKEGDMPLERIREIVLSEKFADEVPFGAIVFTGNGYQVHLKHEWQHVDTNEKAKRWSDIHEYEAKIAAVHKRLAEEFGLIADPNAAEINRNYRMPGTWNVKAMTHRDDYGARKKAEIVVARGHAPGAVWKWMVEMGGRYPPPPKPVRTVLPDIDLAVAEESLRAAMDALSCEKMTRDEWIRVGMALKHWDATRGFAVWDAWSRKDPDRYDERIMQGQWDSFRPDGGVTLGTLFHLAKEHGYVPPGCLWTDPPPRRVQIPPPAGEAVRTTPAADDLAHVPEETADVLSFVAEEEMAMPEGEEPSGPAEQIPSPAPAAEASESKLPLLQMFGQYRSITDTAAEVAELLAKEQTLYSKGGNPVRIGKDGTLQELRADTMRSLIETVCTPYRPDKIGRPIRVTLGKSEAEALLASTVLGDSLDPIEVTVHCPLLDHGADGSLVPKSGYVKRLLAYSTADDVEEPSDLSTAVDTLRLLFKDFVFTTPADQSRAVAALLTPAIVFNRLITKRSPGILVTADESQTGKGFLLGLIAAVYGESVASVSSGEGVAKIDEVFDATLVRGQPFVVVDNVRGKLDSQKIESFMTESSYMARSAYVRAMTVNPARYILGFTSNKMETTPDLANRCNCISLRKQRRKFPVWKLPDGSLGDLHDLVKANQPKFLGAVYRILREWVGQGKPSKDVPVYTAFQQFWSVMEYIVTDIMGMESPTATLGSSVAIMTCPVALFLRDVAMICDRSHLLDDELSVSKMLEIASVNNVDTAFLRKSDWIGEDDGNGTAAKTSLGRLLAGFFAESNAIEIENYSVARSESLDSSTGKTIRRYTFTKRAPLTFDSTSVGGDVVKAGTETRLLGGGDVELSDVIISPEPGSGPVSPLSPPIPPYLPLSPKRFLAEFGSLDSESQLKKVTAIGGDRGDRGEPASSDSGEVQIVKDEAPVVSPEPVSQEPTLVRDQSSVTVLRYRDVVAREPKVRDVGLKR
jgi:hypothetical protein